MNMFSACESGRGVGNLTLSILACRLQENLLSLVSCYNKEGKPLSDALCEMVFVETV